MSDCIVSIMNPDSEAASAVVLGRMGYVRKLLVANLMTFPPLLLWHTILLYLESKEADPDLLVWCTLAIGYSVSLLFAVYLCIYFNAVVLARERAIIGRDAQIIYSRFEAPFPFHGNFIAGSEKSLFAAVLPFLSWFAILFLLMPQFGSVWEYFGLFLPWPKVLAGLVISGFIPTFLAIDMIFETDLPNQQPQGN